MKILFRVDSGKHIGNGHLVRCLTLADALSKNGHTIYFVCKNHIGARVELISEKFQLFTLVGGVAQDLPTEQQSNYDLWLGGSWQEDLKLTNKIIDQIGGIDLSIIDHYSIDAKYETQLLTKKIFVIDDLMNRQHSCDWLLDQNLSAINDTYKKLSLHKNTTFLLGPTYAILRPEFRALRQTIVRNIFNREIKRIFVFFGSADSHSNTLKFAKNLKPEIINNFEFTLLLNEKHTDFAALEILVKQNPKLKLLKNTENMALEMNNTDLFIGAAGITSYERACLGVASALLCTAKNQESNCLDLEKNECIHFLGQDKNFNAIMLNEFFENYLNNDLYWSRIRQNNFNLVDGLGCQRVLEELNRDSND
jgi:UDP-2,4-diacetamido-2,4,6-trideoxy-beta-L-altropyranose hydrolase